VNDWLAIGAGLNAMYGYMDGQVAVNNLIGGDGRMNIRDETWGFGGNAGIMITPREGTRIGINYLSQVDLNFDAQPSFHNLGPGLGVLLARPPVLDMGMTVPQSVMVGVYQKLNDQWALMADVGWQDWSQFSQVTIGVNTANPTRDRDLTSNLHFNDTYHGAIGVEYLYSENWRFTGGFAYDTSAVDDADRSVTLPVGDTYRYGLGAFWKISKSVDLGAAYELVWAGNMPVTQSSAFRGTVSGSYHEAYLSFFSVNLNWRF
jgi:long-chain fatty acid transport protein